MHDYIEFIQKRYHECLNSHEQCAALSDFGWLSMDRYRPTRLICITSTSRQTPFLCEPANNWEDPHENSSKYIALSHCWGTSQIITTTKATYNDRKAGIQWSSLSKTFQDAITIARKLRRPIHLDRFPLHYPRRHLRLGQRSLADVLCIQKFLPNHRRHSSIERPRGLFFPPA